MWDTNLTVVDGPYDPRYECTFECDSGTDDEGMGRPVYLFTNNDGPNIRNSGSREITTNLRTSVDPVPLWLNDAAQDEEHTSSEVQDGFCLQSYEE